jgi:hypothetical protein
MNRLTKAFIIAGCLATIAPVILLAAGPATITINQNIPEFQGVSGSSPCGWLVNFYSFALYFSGILAFGAIVYGGLLSVTSAGNPTRQTEGRAWIRSALLGLLLLAGAYLILHTINPTLTSCSLPQLPGVQPVAGFGDAGSSLGGGAVGSGAGSTSAGALCQAPASGPCSLAALQGSCFANLQTAGGVCNSESNGNPSAHGDKCDDGNYASWGLFQINLSANIIKDPQTGKTLSCRDAFSNAYTGSNPHCTVTNQTLYQQCVSAAVNPSTNIAKACELSGGGTSWKQWGPATLRACGL